MKTPPHNHAQEKRLPSHAPLVRFCSTKTDIQLVLLPERWDLFCELSPALTSSLTSVPTANCLLSLSMWIASVQLKLNKHKTQLLMLRPPPKHASGNSLSQEVATPRFGILSPNTGIILDSFPPPLHPHLIQLQIPVGCTFEIYLKGCYEHEWVDILKLFEQCLAYNKHFMNIYWVRLFPHSLRSPLKCHLTREASSVHPTCTR